MRLLVLLADEASVVGSRERWAGGMGLSAVFGRSMTSERLRDGGAFGCETCDARGDVVGARRVDGAVMLRDDDECARTAGVPSSVGREAQQP